jgi:hypothetical protein
MSIRIFTTHFTEVNQVKRGDGTFVAKAVTITGITVNRRIGRLV